MASADSRTSKSLKNSYAAIGYYIPSLLLQFFSRKIFLDHLGTEILGLNTTAMNLLQFLNIAELGIASAVGFTLYKPLYDNDIKSINEIVDLQGKLYARIAWIIIIGAGVLMCFFPMIFGKIKLPLWYAYASFGVLLFSALLGYFFNYRQIILSASQQNYKILFSFKSVNMVKIAVQMAAVAWLKDGYVWWLVLEVVFAVIASLSLHRTTMKAFPFLSSSGKRYRELRLKYPEFTTKVKQLFFHKIGNFALTQTSPLIIYAYATLTLVALYGNYLVIVTGITILVGTVFNSINASVGNLVAEGDKAKTLRVFHEMFSLYFFLVSSIIFICYISIPDLITLWIGKEYLLENTTLVIILITLFINLMRYAADAFINAYGLFSDIWSPIAESSINIGFSILFGYFFGINGVLSGVLLSLLVIIVGWKPLFLFLKEFPGEYHNYVKGYLLHLLIGSVVAVMSWLAVESIPFNLNSWWGLILKVMTAAAIYCPILLGTLWTARTGIAGFISRIAPRSGKR